MFLSLYLQLLGASYFLVLSDFLVVSISSTPQPPPQSSPALSQAQERGESVVLDLSSGGSERLCLWSC